SGWERGQDVAERDLERSGLDGATHGDDAVRPLETGAELGPGHPRVDELDRAERTHERRTGGEPRCASEERRPEPAKVSVGDARAPACTRLARLGQPRCESTRADRELVHTRSD